VSRGLFGSVAELRKMGLGMGAMAHWEPIDSLPVNEVRSRRSPLVVVRRSSGFCPLFARANALMRVHFGLYSPHE
jgi:hypothetical protein